MVEIAAVFDGYLMEKEGRYFMKDVPFMHGSYESLEKLEEALRVHATELASLICGLGIGQSIASLLDHQLAACGWSSLALTLDTQVGMIEFPHGQIMDIGQCVLFLTWVSRLAAPQRENIDALIDKWQKELLVDL